MNLTLGYGERPSSPCRQRTIGYSAFISREWLSSTLLKVISRPAGLLVVSSLKVSALISEALDRDSVLITPYVIRGDLKFKANYPKLGIWRFSGVLAFINFKNALTV